MKKTRAPHLRRLLPTRNPAADPRRKRGFALIISLTLMSFIVLLILSLTAMTRVETEVSKTAAEYQKAREYARMALFQAIGQLQRHAGKDTVATARADIIKQSGSILQGNFTQPAHLTNRFWTGVWNHSPDVDGNNGLYGLDGHIKVDSQGRPLFPPQVTWLISGKGDDEDTPPDLDPKDPTDHTATVATGLMAGQSKYVKMVGPKVTVDGQVSSDPQDAVYAQAEAIYSIENPEVPEERTLHGRLAYWIGDDGIKAKVNRADPFKEEADANERIYRRTASQAPGMAAIEDFDGYANLDPDLLKKVHTPEMLQLTEYTSKDKAEVFKRKFHDITTYSRSVLSDSRRGGLKKDLTAGLRDGTGFTRLTQASEGYERATPDRMFDPEGDQSTGRDPGGPFWDQLKSFHTTLASDNTIEVRPQSEREHGYSPVVTLFQQFYALSYIESPGNILNPSSSYKVNFHVMPAVILWNPYDVELAATDYTVVFWRNTWPGNSGGYRGQFFHDRFSISNPNAGGEGVTLTPDQRREHAPPFDFKHKSKYVIANEPFKPGEAKIFTPEAHDEYDFGGQVNFLVNAWNPGYTFYSDLLTTDNYPGRDIQKLKLPKDSYRFSFQLQRSRRSCVELYKGQQDFDDEGNVEDLPLVYIKKLNTNDVPSNPTNVLPVSFDAASNAPLLTDEQYDRMYGRKFVMRMAFNDYDQRGDREYRVGSGMTKKVKWLGMLNPRSNTFGRRPFELRDWTGFYNPANYMTHVHGTGREVFDLIDDEGTAFVGYSQEKEGTTETVLFEVPRSKDHFISIGQYMHANLTIAHGGSYRDYFDAKYGIEEFWGDNNRPAYLIGNSWANAGMPLDRVNYQSTMSGDAGTSHTAFDYDHVYKLNEQLWDRYFLSTVPEGGMEREGDDYKPLPNSRLKLYEAEEPRPGVSGAPQEVAAGLAEDFDTAAAAFLLDGGFNVNSTSKEAWKALLGSFIGVEVELESGTDANPAESRSSPMLRISTPHGKAVDESDNVETENTYIGYRKLTPEEIDMLAGEIVEQVKERGPFSSLADFINRDPYADDTWKQVKGALACAIDSQPNTPYSNSRPNQQGPINAKYFSDDQYVIEADDFNASAYRGREAAAGAIAEATPGYLTQQDILARLGHVLTTRSDTFTVRAYGEVRNPTTGALESKAWCEGVVQRVPEYVDANAEDGDLPETHPVALRSETNKKFGRRFKLVSFRWLTEDEL